MILSMLLLATIQVPDSAPALEAVKTCNRGEIRRMIANEPHRRTEFAAAAYAEQRAIAQERALLLAPPAAGAEASPPADLAMTANALGQLDARQKQLDDARAIEMSWRGLFDEMRADFLANCNGKKDAQ